MKPVMLTADNFKEEVLETSGLILIDCYADWCGPCKMSSSGSVTQWVFLQRNGRTSRYARSMWMNSLPLHRRFKYPVFHC